MKNVTAVIKVHKVPASNFGSIYRKLCAAFRQYSELNAYMLAVPDADTRTQCSIKKAELLKDVESTIVNFIMKEYGLPEEIATKVYAKAYKGDNLTEGFYGILTKAERISEATIRGYIADEFGLPASVAAIVYKKAFQENLSAGGPDNVLTTATRIGEFAGEIVKATKQSFVKG